VSEEPQADPYDADFLVHRGRAEEPRREEPLVERLRIQGNKVVNYSFGIKVAELLYEAADELTRLKAQRDEWRSVVVPEGGALSPEFAKRFLTHCTDALVKRAEAAEQLLASSAVVVGADQQERTYLYWQLRVEHARKQGAADGFQAGWHAALRRVADGDDIAELTSLVPSPALPDPGSPEREK
jgi:hypothetical protein